MIMLKIKSKQIIARTLRGFSFIKESVRVYEDILIFGESLTLNKNVAKICSKCNLKVDEIQSNYNISNEHFTDFY